MGNYNNKGFDPKTEAEGFLTPQEKKIEGGKHDGEDYYKGTLMFEGGRGVSLTVFPIDGKKAKYAIKARLFKSEQRKNRGW